VVGPEQGLTGAREVKAATWLRIEDVAPDPLPTRGAGRKVKALRFPLAQHSARTDCLRTTPDAPRGREGARIIVVRDASVVFARCEAKAPNRRSRTIIVRMESWECSFSARLRVKGASGRAERTGVECCGAHSRFRCRQSCRKPNSPRTRRTPRHQRDRTSPAIPPLMTAKSAFHRCLISKLP